MLGNEQHPGAVPKSLSLEEIVAERIASEAARIAEDLIREAFAVTEFDPDEVYGFMNSEEAAEFLGLPYSSFREIDVHFVQAEFFARLSLDFAPIERD
jgi:hypothetical protein